MRYLTAFFLMLGLLAPSYTKAQEGVTSFQQNRDSWRRSDGDEKIRVMQSIRDSMGPSATRNIEEAEQVFCYVVDIAASGYEGYTINNVAVKSFCGSLNKEIRDVIIASLFVREDKVSTKLEQCMIRPRLMYRFVRGVDYTDVLLSSPCYSFTFFYGGKMKTYNFSNGSAIINDLVEIFDSPDAVPFVSPALLEQLMPIGVAETKEEEVKINQGPKTPVRNWSTESQSQKGGSGWNNLKR